MRLNNIVNKEKGVSLFELGVAGSALAGIAIVGFAGYKAIQTLDTYNNKPIIERSNVIGAQKAELFIEQDGKRFYAEIDGKPIAEYLGSHK